MLKSLRLFSIPLLLTILLSLGLSYNAYSQPFLYAVDGAGFTASSLHIFDLETGQFIQTIGPTGFNHVTGIAFHPETGVLYGVVNSPQILITIDINTGAGTPIGPTGGQFPDIDFSWGGTLYGWNENSDDLYTINLLNGSITLVEPSNFGTSSTGLAFDAFDNLFVKSGSTLHSVDASTGLSTGSITLSQFLNNILTVDTSNSRMYSGCRIDNCGSNQIVVIHPKTGVVTELATHNLDSLSALAIMKEPIQLNVPTLSEWGLIAMAGILGIVGFIVVRRRQVVA